MLQLSWESLEFLHVHAQLCSMIPWPNTISTQIFVPTMFCVENPIQDILLTSNPVIWTFSTHLHLNWCLHMFLSTAQRQYRRFVVISQQSEHLEATHHQIWYRVLRWRKHGLVWPHSNPGGSCLQMGMGMVPGQIRDYALYFPVMCHRVWYLWHLFQLLLHRLCRCWSWQHPLTQEMHETAKRVMHVTTITTFNYERECWISWLRHQRSNCERCFLLILLYKARVFCFCIVYLILTILTTVLLTCSLHGHLQHRFGITFTSSWF